MEEMNKQENVVPQGQPERTFYQYYPYYPYHQPPVAPPRRMELYPAGKREMVFLVLAVICGLMIANFVIFGGFQLGFAVASILCVCFSAGYLVCSGLRPTAYSAVVMILGIVITAGFARSDDGDVKFVLLHFLILSGSLSLCLMAGQQRFAVGGIGSLLDGPRCLFGMGFGNIGHAVGGVGRSLKRGGPAVKKGGAVAVGLLVAVPLLCVLIPLLMSADAAFDGLIHQLPQISLGEILVTAIFGVGIALVIFSRGTALVHRKKEEVEHQIFDAGLNHLTVDTVLGVAGLVYVVYLLSQLAYFVGGFSGILPESFTMAEYARRGFFEMAALCGVDLLVIALAVGLVGKKDGKTPLSTRLLCLFIGLVTLFFVATASAKMMMYIDAYGLTRLRVLTEVVMVFLGAATAIVCLWLFLPKLRYMQWVLILALVLGAVVIWADVDTVVASYNVSAYQSGKLSTIDMDHLSCLGDGAIPFVAELTDDPDPMVAERAAWILEGREDVDADLRGWNYAQWYADQVTEE